MFARTTILKEIATPRVLPSVAHFHSSAMASRRLRGSIVLKEPIMPTIGNIKVPEDHPLWQFFPNKQYLRKPEDLDTGVRSWSIPELRRKSFEDLQIIWYKNLIEINALAREEKLVEKFHEGDFETFVSQSNMCRETLWRIRHVLSEQYHGWEEGQKEFLKNKSKILKSFKKRYLATEIEDTDIAEQLERAQYAYFGISTDIAENTVDKNFADGIRYIANLKFAKFKPHSGVEIDQLKDIGECYIVFTASHDLEGMKSALNNVLEYRKETDGVITPFYKEMEVLDKYVQKQQS